MLRGLFLSATPAYWRVQELQKLPKPPLSRCVWLGRLLLADVFKRYSRLDFWRFTVHSTVGKTLKMFVKPRLCLKLRFLRLFDLCLCYLAAFFKPFFRDSWGWGVKVGWVAAYLTSAVCKRARLERWEETVHSSWCGREYESHPCSHELSREKGGIYRKWNYCCGEQNSVDT